MLTFSLVANFVSALGIFPHTTDIGSSTNTSGAIGDYSTLSESESSMWSIFTTATLAAGLAVAGLAYATRSITPIGIYLFGIVFWASWINMNSILGYGDFIPGDLLTVVTIGVMFVFIAAVVGMLTGSG